VLTGPYLRRAALLRLTTAAARFYRSRKKDFSTPRGGVQEIFWEILKNVEKDVIGIFLHIQNGSGNWFEAYPHLYYIVAPLSVLSET
jgi:hypothetical protein